MKRAITSVAAVAAAVLALAAPAAAQSHPATGPALSESSSSQAPSLYGFGMRIGGYGFRNPQATEVREKWSDCRMNGVGVFGQRELSHAAFIEAGSDIYFSDNFILDSESRHAARMDRLSGLFSVALGLRMFPNSRISAFGQIGAGLELTRVELGSGDQHTAHDEASPDGAAASMSAPSTQIENTAMPLVFLGFGADLRLGSRARVGVNLRTYLMAHYDHGDHGEAVPTLKAEPEAANQVQFYLRYTL